MKTKEELNALKEEVEALNEKLRELSEEELEKVAGGEDPRAVCAPLNASTYFQCMLKCAKYGGLY